MSLKQNIIFRFDKNFAFQVARSGSLVQLEELLAKLPAKEGSWVQGPGFGSRAAVLNHARRWTEVQEKWGYDKS